MVARLSIPVYSAYELVSVKVSRAFYSGDLCNHVSVEYESLDILLLHFHCLEVQIGRSE